ncbi:MAG: hypothetical protein BYD32DRAFT_414164 [Podila humilis]|nr:MAG: hypothetical protein BYD32DRAFT_414164 [Podila humilis]
MDVCQPPSTNFLDTVFGTDGRKRKDKGVWTWIKTAAKSSTSEKRKSKLAQQQQLQQQQHLPNHINTRSSSVASNMSYASSTTLPVAGLSSPSSYAPSSPTHSSQSTFSFNHSSRNNNSKRSSLISTSSTHSSSTLQSPTSPHPLPRQRTQSAYALPFASQTLPYHPQYQQSESLYHSNIRRMDPGRRASESNMPKMTAHQGPIQRSASAGRTRPFGGRDISEAAEPMTEESDVEDELRRSRSKEQGWWWE